MRKTSLSTRIALLVVLILAVGMGISGLLLVRAVRDAQKRSIAGRLNARLAWLESALDADYDEGKIELEASGSPTGVARGWSVATTAGRVLWSGPRPEPRPRHQVRSERRFCFGNNDWPLLDDHELRQAKEIEPDQQEGEWRYHGRNRQLSIYRFTPRKVRVVLVLQAAVDTSQTHEEIERLRTTLAIGIPLVVIGLGLIMILLVRRQLSPLQEMAQESALVGPESLAARITAGGPSRECNQLRDSINRMIERMAQGIERERMFAQAAAHDLRTPLAQLRTQAELALRHPRNNEEYQQALGEIHEDIVRLEQLITGLLLLARSESRESTLSRKASLTNIIHDICAADQQLQPPDLPTSDPLWIKGEASLIHTAISNVLRNALEYAPATPPRMRITATREVLELTITDQGPGIPTQEREHIFKPLVRLDEARTARPDAGFGLGLAITRNILRAFGGDIVCQAPSNGQSGARFVLRFRFAS